MSNPHQPHDPSPELPRGERPSGELPSTELPSGELPSTEIPTWDDVRITSYVMGELSGAQREQFETQIAGDAELKAAVHQARCVTERLQRLMLDEPAERLDHQRREEIFAAAENAPLQHAVTLAESDSSKSRLIPWLLTIAATILLALAVIPALQRPQLAQQPNGERSEPPSSERAIAQSSSELEAAVAMAVVDESMDRLEPIADSVDAPSAVDQLAAIELDEQSPTSTGMLRSVAGTAITSPANASPANTSPASVHPVPQSTLELSSELPRTQIAETIATHDKRLLRKDQSVASGRQVKAEMAEAELAQVEFAPVNELQLSILPAASQPSPAPSSPLPATRGRVMFGAAVNDESWTIEATRRRRGEATGQRGLESKSLQHHLSDRVNELHRVGENHDRFDPITENGFKHVIDHPLSTFSVDVDTASYSKVRRFLNEGMLPPPGAVRIEELVNYFDYQYEPPAEDAQHPFATHVTLARCPWNSEHRLARVAIQGKAIDRQSRPSCNLVFLIDTSGSMKSANKLPLVIDGMKLLTKQLGQRDRVAIVVYAGSAGMVLESTSAEKKKVIKRALSRLEAGGSTNGGAGIQLAYSVARDSFIKDGVNRVILCTDGDFNVGMSGTDQLVRLIEEESSGGIFLTALGFGMGNHNDAMMEQISGKGNGNYAFIDTVNEAKKVLVRQTEGTLVTIAKDVKVQIEFNRRYYSKYRLIGYENRVLAKEDFNDDQKDAGEIGAGHQVTALYELVPAGSQLDEPADEPVERQSNDAPPTSQVDPLKYQSTPKLTEAAFGDDALTVKLRYKQPDGDSSTLIEFEAKDRDEAFDSMDPDFRFAASVASFAMQLRRSQFAGDWQVSDVRRVAEASLGEDEFGMRAEFLELVRKASQMGISGE